MPQNTWNGTTYSWPDPPIPPHQRGQKAGAPMLRPQSSRTAKGACAFAGIVLLVVATIILLLLLPTGGYLSPGLDVIMALVFCVGLALVSAGFK